MSDDVSGSNSVGVVQPVKGKRGRPRKEDVLAKKKGNRGVRGRPPGDAARIAEFKARLLAAPVGTKVIEKVLQIAQSDEHPGQMAALKMCMDRMLPLSLFEKEAGGRGNQIQINISTVSPVDISSNSKDIDAEDVDFIEQEP